MEPVRHLGSRTGIPGAPAPFDVDIVVHIDILEEPVDGGPRASSQLVCDRAPAAWG